MFDSLTSRLSGAFSGLRAKGRLTERDVDEALHEIRLALLEADVEVGVVKRLIERVRERAVGSEVSKSLTPGHQVTKIVGEELVTTLGSDAVPLTAATKAPTVIFLVGLQGSGKTTTAAKVARMLSREGRRPLLVAADLQRPAAIDQLETLAGRIGVSIAVERGSEPARVLKAALGRARTEGFDRVIVDTAGRLHVDDHLMSELADLHSVAQPDEVLLVVDAMTGQDAVAVATGFMERIDISGIVLSKLDGDARGGAAISVAEVTGRPVKFVGVGEGVDDLEAFHPERMASRILGMGDVMSLIEKAEQTWDDGEAARVADKVRTASFTFEDFLDQFQQLKRMGSMSQLLGMLPGASAMQHADVSDRDLGRVEAMIRAMTPGERLNPKIIDGSRRRRIARGSGTSPQEVNGLLRQFAQTQKMIKALAEGRSPIPGLTVPGRGRRKR
jgi:signal recognition particle subunit SRP54